MEIGNNPRLLFNHLGQAIVENNKYSNVCEMRLMDRITLSVDKSFETRVGFPYTMAGKSKEYIRIQPGSTIDNEPATDDTIYFQNRKKDYAVLEKQHRGSLS